MNVFIDIYDRREEVNVIHRSNGRLIDISFVERDGCAYDDITVHNAEIIFNNNRSFTITGYIPTQNHNDIQKEYILKSFELHMFYVGD